jgi:Peptidase propeptide and YPEB domain
VLALALLVSQTCQREQIRLSKDDAIAIAEREIEFEPTRTQVRLLRQGLNAKPYWVVSMSIPNAGADVDTEEFRELAVVRIDANTGKVQDVKVQR